MFMTKDFFAARKVGYGVPKDLQEAEMHATCKRGCGCSRCAAARMQLICSAEYEKVVRV